MNTESPLFDLPDDLNQQLAWDFDNKLQQGHVVEAMYHGFRPYYSIAQVKQELDQQSLEDSYSRDTIRDRLNEMTEIGVLRKEVVNNGDVWWIDHSLTRWPKPPDAELYPPEDDDEASVSELLSRPEVAIGVVSILTAAGAGIVVWLATLQIQGIISLPFETSWILALGLTIILVSYFGLLLAGVVWMLRKVFEPHLGDVSLRELLQG